VVWPLNKRLVLWIIGIVVVLLILGSIGGVWLWGVLSGYIQPKTPTDKKDLVNIFVLIAAGLVGTLTALAALGNLYFSRMNLQNARETLQQQRVLDDRRAQDEAIQAYLEQMSKLMGDEDAPLRFSREGDEVVGDKVREVRTLARAHTLTVLRRLYPDRKRNVLNFLYEADLIKLPQPVIDLGSPDFEYSAADLSGADLSGADLTGADLRGALGVTEEQLDLVWRLEGAIMPNGKKFEDWIKGGYNQVITCEPDRGLPFFLERRPTFPKVQELKAKEGRGEDGENSGPM
jgi:hypothetical protein